jgi:hypothetical protein
MPYKDPEKRKECNRKKNKKYRENNLERLRAEARERYAQANPPKPKKPARTKEERLAYQRAYYQANKEKCKELCRKWVQNNRERMREIVRDWQINNPERCKELRQQYRDKNKEKIREYAKEGAKRRFAENPEKVREQRKAVKERLLVKDPDKYLENRRRYVRNSSKKRVGEIKDDYVAHLLFKSSGYNLKAKDIPKELIEAKRLQLMIKRELEK